MANTKSAKKAARQALHRAEVNRSRRSRIRTFVRAVEEAVSAGDAPKAAAALRQAEPELARGARKGLFHKNMASRKVSRLSRQIKNLVLTS